MKGFSDPCPIHGVRWSPPEGTCPQCEPGYEDNGMMAERLGRPDYPEQCEHCAGGGWKLCNPPICTGCGHRPVNRYYDEDEDDRFWAELAVEEPKLYAAVGGRPFRESRGILGATAINDEPIAPAVRRRIIGPIEMTGEVFRKIQEES